MKLLGPRTKKLRNSINSIFQGKVPDALKLSQINLICKGRGNKGFINSYHLITVTSVQNNHAGVEKDSTGMDRGRGDPQSFKMDLEAEEG